MEYVIKSASKVCIKNIFNRIEEIHLLIITTSTVPPSAVPRYGVLSADATLGPDSPGSRWSRATLDFLKVVRLALRARTIALRASKARRVSKSSATPAGDKLTLIVLW